MPIYCVKVKIAQSLCCSEKDFGIISQRIETRLSGTSSTVFSVLKFSRICKFVFVTTISSGLLRCINVLRFLQEVGVMSDISLGGISGVYSAIDISVNAKADAVANEALKEAETKAADSGVIYEKSAEVEEKKAIYSINKMSAEDRAALVQQLKEDQVARQNQLAELVRQMFSDQAGVSKLADLFTPEKLKDVKPEDIEQAKKDVAEDGYWGVKQTSQRLFDFASALAGDDPDKMKEMQAAMEKGFKEATGAWGDELPDICKDTLAAANKMFEEYYDSKG